MPKKAATTLTAQERVILFCTGTGIAHADVGITAHAMQSMAIKGFIVHDRESGAYTLTDSGRATLAAMLQDAGLK
jgi:hypothetical protein